MILLFVVNSPDFFLSHRLEVAKAAKNCGYEVHVATGRGLACSEIEDHGFVHHSLNLSRSGTRPLIEFHLLIQIYLLFRRISPDIVHLVTIKPVIYGGLCARLIKVRGVVAAISGLGTAFIHGESRRSILRFILKFLFRFALDLPNIHVIFQNSTDMGELIGIRAVSESNSSIIKGSGVSLERFSFVSEPVGVPVVTFAARLLFDKGVREFIQAARLLKDRGVVAEFWIVGSRDPENLSSISEQELEDWKKELCIRIHGFEKNINDVFSRSNLVVLPSYREGFPKVLMEAAACGRAIVTTDVAGCRDAIIPDQTGLLVPAKDIHALANAIQTLVEDPIRRGVMGTRGRALAEAEYGIERVIEAHIEIYQSLVPLCGVEG